MADPFDDEESYENDFDEVSEASLSPPPSYREAPTSPEHYIPIEAKDAEEEHREQQQQQQQEPPPSYQASFFQNDGAGMANMRTIEDLQDILCELPSDYKAQASLSPRPNGGALSPINGTTPRHTGQEQQQQPLHMNDPDLHFGTSRLGEGYGADNSRPRPDSSTSTSPPPVSNANLHHHQKKKNGNLDPAMLDNYVMRLILNSALLDLPPKEKAASSSSATSAHAVTTTHHVRPYWEYAAANQEGLPSPFYVASPTRMAASSSSSSSPSKHYRSSPYSPPSSRQQRQQPVKQENNAGGISMESSSYVDTARYERAKILALAQHIDEVESVEERIAKRKAKLPTSGGGRGNRRYLEATSEEKRLFEEHYARYVSRLSYLSRQDQEDEQELYNDVDLDPEAAKERRLSLSMATALSGSITQVMSDAVVIDLIKESAIIRMRGMEQEKQKKHVLQHIRRGGE